MSALETVVLDSLGASPLTLQSGDPGGSVVYSLEDLDLGLAARRPNWVGGAGADGQLLPQDPPYDDAVMTATVQVFPATDSKDAAYAAVQALTLKLQECSASGPDGLACTYQAANSSNTYTFFVKLAEYDGAMPLTPTTPEGFMTINNKPTVKLRLTRRPFFYLPEIGTVLDDFSTNTLGTNYTADAGPATFNVSGGQLVPTSTAEKRLVRVVGGYDSLGKYYDSQVTVKVVTGASAAGGWAVGLILKRLDSSNYLFGNLTVSGASSALQVFKSDAGSVSALGSASSTFTVATGTSYWVRARIEGSTVYVRIYTVDPVANPTTAATASVSYTLAGADATKFGQGVGGQVGLRTNTIPTDWRYDDLTVEPNTWHSSLPLLTGLLPGVPGDAAATVRLLFTDLAAQSRRFAEIGIEQPRYDITTPLLVTAGSLVTTGFAGSATTRTGAYS